MNDLSKLIEYDKTFPVAIKNPATGEAIGLVFHVVSIESERVVKATRKLERDILASKATATPIADEDVPEQFLRTRLIAAIDSWEWGGLEYGELGADPECSESNKAYLINHPNAKWIKDQLVMGCADIANFTAPSQKPALNTSKKK